MSILDALRQHNSSIDDLAKLPQAMIMQMAQRKEISEDMLAPILSRKAEMMDAVARTKSLQPQSAPPTVMEQMMAKNAQAEQPQTVQMALQGQQAPQMPQQMAQLPEDVGIATQPTQPMRMAGGGIIAFSKGDLVDLEDDMDEEDLIAEYADAMKAGEMAMMRDQAGHGNAGVGIKFHEPMPKGASQGMVSNEDQARKHNVGNLRPSGFSYEGQVGTSKGGFAMFDSPESGLKALQHDIGIKLNRGLDTPTKFISVYAPAGDKNDVGAYSNNVAKMLGIGANDKIPNTPEAKQLLAQAIIRQEGAHKATAAFANGGEIKHFVNNGYVNSDDDRSAFQQDLVDTFGYSNAADKSPEKPEWLQNTIEYFTKPKNRTGKTAYIPNADANLDNRDVGTKGSMKPPAPSLNAPTPQGGLTNEEMMRGSTRAGTWDALSNDQTTGRALPQAAPSYWDKVAAQMEQDRADNIKQKSEDRNMALLTAGLGMIGGSSQHAGENIGKGALAGVQYLSEANKLRGSEKAALDKNALIAQRYKELGETAKGNQAGLMALRQGELAVSQGKLTEAERTHNLSAIGQMEKNSLAKAMAALKAQGLLGEDISNPQTQRALNDWVQNDLANNKAYNNMYRNVYGFDYDVGQNAGSPTGGNTMRFDKNGKLIK